MKSTLLFPALLLFVICVSPGKSGEGTDASIPPRGGHGRVQIITNPPQAVAYMGGEKLGLTPVDTIVPSGRQKLTIILNGEDLVQEERVNVWPDSTLVIRKTLLMPYGSLTVKTEPLKWDCKVFIDDEDVGSTQGAPLTINHIRAGDHAIRVVYGKKSRENSVLILPEKSVDLMVNFTIE